jgi:hypothetical protein
MALLDREAEDMLSILGMDLKARNPQKIRTFKWSHIPFEQSFIDSDIIVKRIKAQ